MRTRQRYGVEMRQWHPHEFGMELATRSRTGRRVNRLGDLEARDPAALFCEQWTATGCRSLESGLFGERELMHVREASCAWGGAVKQQRIPALAPYADHETLLDDFRGEVRIRFGFASLGRGAERTHRTG